MTERYPVHAGVCGHLIGWSDHRPLSASALNSDQRYCDDCLQFQTVSQNFDAARDNFARYGDFNLDDPARLAARREYDIARANLANHIMDMEDQDLQRRQRRGAISEQPYVRSASWTDPPPAYNDLYGTRAATPNVSQNHPNEHRDRTPQDYDRGHLDHSSDPHADQSNSGFRDTSDSPSYMYQGIGPVRTMSSRRTRRRDPESSSARRTRRRRGSWPRPEHPIQAFPHEASPFVDEQTLRRNRRVTDLNNNPGVIEWRRVSEEIARENRAMGL